MTQTTNATNTTDLGWERRRSLQAAHLPLHLNNTHILHFLDERVFPLKDHKEQLGTSFGGRPLVDVVDHTRLGTEERNCHLAGASGTGSMARGSQTLALLTHTILGGESAPNLTHTTP